MAPKKKTARPWWLRCLCRPGTWLVLLAGTALVGVSWLVPGLIRDLRAQQDYQYPLTTLRINPAPEWVPHNLVSQVLDQSDLSGNVSLLRPGLAQQLASAFEKHPWIRKVDRVQITGRRAVVVQVQYREPVAFIDSLGGTVPVDSHGALLPAEDFAPTDRENYPLVRGIESFPPDRPGQMWPDPMVLQALPLAQALSPNHDMQRYWTEFELVAIVAPHVTTEEERLLHRTIFELETKGGSRIVWGHPPGGDDLEPTVAQKLGRLDQYQRQFGGFEQPRGPYRIDIRHFEAISLQPLTLR